MMKHLQCAGSPVGKRSPFAFQMSSVLALVSLIVSAHPSGVASKRQPSFTDPSATVQCGLRRFKSCTIGSGVYIAPFATLKAGPISSRKTSSISIGDDSNVQDNALLDTTTNNRPIAIGEKVIIAHGASVFGGAQIGVSGSCQSGSTVCPSFVGFNSEVAEDAVIQRDAMVMHLARVGPGVTIPSGRKVISGKNVLSNSEVPAKTEPVDNDDRRFMNSVLEVNTDLAVGYSELLRQDPSNVRGVNYNPITHLNPKSILPSFAGTERRDPLSRSRIIGDVRFADRVLPSVGVNVSLRADEGTPFVVGTIRGLKDSTTFHALEHTKLSLGDNGSYGYGSVVHGGSFNNNTTSTGSNFVLGDNSVFFNATAADNCKVDAMSLVLETNLLAGTVVPSRVVKFRDQTWDVEWERRPRK